MCDKKTGTFWAYKVGSDSIPPCGVRVMEKSPVVDATGEEWIRSEGDNVLWYVGKYGDSDSSTEVARFEACSGRVVVIVKEDPNPLLSITFKIGQNSKDQCHKNIGPTIEGDYELDITPSTKVAKYTKDGENVKLKPNNNGGIEEIPNDPHSLKELWGNKRVRLEYIEDKSGVIHDRDLNSFYFHDSEKDETDGCIEVDSGFFVKLEKYRDTMKKTNMGKIKIRVEVKYPSSNHITKSTQRHKNEKH